MNFSSFSWRYSNIYIEVHEKLFILGVLEKKKLLKECAGRWYEKMKT